MFVYIVIWYINFHGCDFFRRVGVVGVGGAFSVAKRLFSFPSGGRNRVISRSCCQICSLMVLEISLDIIILISQ